MATKITTATGVTVSVDDDVATRLLAGGGYHVPGTHTPAEHGLTQPATGKNPKTSK